MSDGAHVSLFPVFLCRNCRKQIVSCGLLLSDRRKNYAGVSLYFQCVIKGPSTLFNVTLNNITSILSVYELKDSNIERHLSATSFAKSFCPSRRKHWKQSLSISPPLKEFSKKVNFQWHKMSFGHVQKAKNAEIFVSQKYLWTARVVRGLLTSLSRVLKRFTMPTELPVSHVEVMISIQ